jgi:protein N-terminal methyltransferase
MNSAEEMYLNKPVHLFYSEGKKYWKDIQASVDGVLGGLGYLDEIDIQGSRHFMENQILPYLRNNKCEITKPVADCGAGIGRVTKNLLLDYFGCVDIVESDSKFLTKAVEECKERNSTNARFLLEGLEEFVPEDGRYCLLWCQWVLSHLTDNDVVAFISRALNSLRNVGGILILKENEAKNSDYIMDDIDSSVTRSARIWKKLILKAGGNLVFYEEQKGFPMGLFRVGMYAIN